MYGPVPTALAWSHAWPWSFGPVEWSAKTWLEDALNGNRRVGILWMSLIAFVRIATNPRARPSTETRARRGRPSGSYPAHLGFQRLAREEDLVGQALLDDLAVEL